MTEASVVGPYTLGTANIGAQRLPPGNGSAAQYTHTRTSADDNFDHTGLNFIGGSNIPGGGYAWEAAGIRQQLLWCGNSHQHEARVQRVLEELLPQELAGGGDHFNYSN